MDDNFDQTLALECEYYKKSENTFFSRAFDLVYRKEQRFDKNQQVKFQAFHRQSGEIKVTS